MTFDVKIYGEIVPFQDKWITEQGGYVNQTEVQNQLKEADGKDIRVRIKSFGGDVEEGFAIYSELRRYAKENNAKVTTLAEGQCASIATVIFLAGDERLVTEFTQPFVHNAWCYAMGDAQTLSKTAVDLEVVNDQIAKHYASHTELTYDEARELMNEETYISPEECVRLRFATAIEQIQRPAALLNRITKPINKSKMNKKTKKVRAKNQSEKSFIKRLQRIFDKDIFTADNEILEFPELDDEDVVSVGDKGYLNGEPANGEVIIANGDVYVFEDGVVVEIREKSEETETETESTQNQEADEVSRLEERILELEADLAERDKYIKELEELLEKANAKMSNLSNKLKNAVSKDAGEQVKDKGNAGGKKQVKATVSEAVLNFKQKKFKLK